MFPIRWPLITFSIQISQEGVRSSKVTTAVLMKHTFSHTCPVTGYWLLFLLTVASLRGALPPLSVFPGRSWVSEVTVLGAAVPRLSTDLEYRLTHNAYGIEVMWAQSWIVTPWVICKTWAMAPENHTEARVRWLSHRCTMGASPARRRSFPIVCMHHVGSFFASKYLADTLGLYF